MTNDNLYGIETTDNVQYDAQGLPLGIYKAMAIGEEPDPQDRGVIVEWEVLNGDNRGRKGKQWILSKHDNPQTANIAKQTLKRIADASGKPISPASPIKGRVVTLEVRQQKKNPDYTEIFKYHPENYTPPAVDDVPFA
jgi:hypothetical protein